MKILIFRSGAFGDCVIITPVIRQLNRQGHELVVVASARGMEVFKGNPHISKLVQHKEDIPIDKLSENIDFLQNKFKCEKVYDFSESIEVSLSQHPRSPNYKLPKFERLARFNRNFYEHSFEHIGMDWNGVDLTPELFFEDNELKEVRKYYIKDKFNVLLALSGSGNNKCWPWMQDFAYKLCEEYPEIHIITIGDEKCKMIEPEGERITNLCGKIPMRQAMALTSVVDFVVAPDTGVIHAAGCYPTPKMCLLGHNTKESIVKHFRNDYSIEADPILSPCSPCLFLIYDMKLQCPLSQDTGSSICMSDGLSLERVLNHFKGVYEELKK